MRPPSSPCYSRRIAYREKMVVSIYCDVLTCSIDSYLHSLAESLYALYRYTEFILEIYFWWNPHLPWNSNNLSSYLVSNWRILQILEIQFHTRYGARYLKSNLASNRHRFRALTGILDLLPNLYTSPCYSFPCIFHLGSWVYIALCSWALIHAYSHRSWMKKDSESVSFLCR